MSHSYLNLKRHLQADLVDTYYIRVKDTEKNSLHQYKGTMGVQKTFRMLISQRRYIRQRFDDQTSCDESAAGSPRFHRAEQNETDGHSEGRGTQHSNVLVFRYAHPKNVG
jgi:hypothetical protein